MGRGRRGEGVRVVDDLENERGLMRSGGGVEVRRGREGEE